MTFALSLLWWSLVPFTSFVEILVAAGLFAANAPRRERFWLRAALIVLLMWGLAMITMWRTASIGGVEQSRQMAPAAGAIALGEALLHAFVLLIATLGLRACFELTPWQAVFCSTVGYAMQNLGSGITESLVIALKAQGLAVGSHAHVFLSLAVCAIVYTVLHLSAIGHVHVEKTSIPDNRGLVVMVMAVIVAVIGFDVLLKEGLPQDMPTGTLLLLRAFHALVCLFTMLVEIEMLANRQLAVEKAAAERLMAEHERQYQMSRESIDAINLKCHDLRHQIRHLADGGAMVDSAVLEDMAREVNVYDSQVKTGNDALDTILTEKSLLCESEGITLTCIADGTALGHMAAADLYSLFGNALDNAIEAVRQVADPKRRSISLVVRERAGMASIHVENWYDPASSAREFVDGLPRTSKADTASHGFGTRSMRAIVEHYGGTLSFSAGNETFSIDAMIPVAR